MENKPEQSKKYSFESFASAATKASGSPLAITIAFLIVLIWGISGPLFHFSQTWQTVISTITTIITFLMVFLIQKSQNKDSLAIQLKLNELVAANEFASNRLLNVEKMTEDELNVIHKYYSKLSDFTKNDDTKTQSHSIDESNELHDIKKEMEQELKSTRHEKDDTADQ